MVKIKGIGNEIGITQGIIKLVITNDDAIGVKKGQIMVCKTIEPEFLRALHKAKAIIAQEGGSTSHAAVLTRELKKPCVYGVNNVMKLFQNGDLVEVDANKGIVKKIN